MAGIKQLAMDDKVEAESIAAASAVQQRVITPSSRHSVLAKAARYRGEPDRVDILVTEPLVAVVHGLHADHTVRQTGQGLVCSCERFQRGGGPCAHVLAVEHQRSVAAASAAVAELGKALIEAIDPVTQPEGSAGLFAHVVVPVFDTSSAPESIAWIREVTRAAGGNLTLFRGTRLEEPGDRIPATLVVLPLQVLGSNAEPSAWHRLVEQLVTSVRVPLLLIPHASANKPLRSVLAAVDGSPVSAKVLEATAAVAHATSASVVVVHVGTHPPRDFNLEESPRSDGPKAWAEHAAEALRSQGFDAVGRAVLGHAAAAIQSIAEDIDADLVVLGTRAQVVRNRPLGSTTSTVLRAPKRPILLVRPDWIVPTLSAAPGSPANSDGEAPASSDKSRSYDVHTSLQANTDRLTTVFSERR